MKRDTAILRLKHLQEVTEAKAEEMDRERERFERLKDPESSPRVVSSFNLFQTPVELADELASQLPLFDGCRVLEPSVGLGRLYQAVRCRSSCPVTMVEQSADCCRELYSMTRGDAESVILQRDFLQVDPAECGRFDVVFMNPPFQRGTDIKHIRHARRFLAAGGVLVSICAAGPRQRRAFAEFDCQPLPAGSFKSEGTNVETMVVRIYG